MASSYYDMMHPGLEQFTYLKCPSKIRAAMINAGGDALPVDVIERRLRETCKRPVRPDVGEPTEKDAEVYAPRRSLALPAPAPIVRPKPKLVLTEQERERIAAIAASIPNRVVEKPKRVVSKKLDPTAENFPQLLTSFVLRRAGINRATFCKARRRGMAKGAAALIAVILRELDAGKFSYPNIARILGKKDHTTIMWAVERWPFYAEEWPQLDVIHAAIHAELQEAGK